jgi:hypothetical protein
MHLGSNSSSDADGEQEVWAYKMARERRQRPMQMHLSLKAELVDAEAWRRIGFDGCASGMVLMKSMPEHVGEQCLLMSDHAGSK